jgi:predicted membrane protein DUF2232
VAAPLGLFLLLQRPMAREALLGAALLGLVAWSVAHATPGFPRLEAAWVCALAGGVAVAFALRPPATGDLVATGLQAVAFAAIGVTLFALPTGTSLEEVRWLGERHFGDQARMLFDALSQAADPGNPALAAFQASAATVVQVVSRLLPGLVLLQSVAALAAAWALYRLLARHPEGAPLPRLRDFRFNDHLVWGIVLALLALVAPFGTSVLRPLGLNLSAFFGALYVARGIGVLLVLAAAAGFGGPFAVVLSALIVVFLLPIAALSTLALGVSDTWVDWRKFAVKVQKK